MTKLIAALVALLALLLLASGCSGSVEITAANDKTTAANDKTTAANDKTAAVDFNGRWTDDADPNQGPGSQISATIDPSGIEVLINSMDVSSLYWKGTFEPGANPKKIVSIGNMAANKQSVIASWDKTTVFQYDDETLTFDISMLGTTRHVHLKKV